MIDFSFQESHHDNIKNANLKECLWFTSLSFFQVNCLLNFNFDMNYSIFKSLKFNLCFKQVVFRVFFIKNEDKAV